MSRLVWNGNKVLRQIERQTTPLVGRISERIADRARQLVPVKSGKLKQSIRATNDGVEVGEDYAAAVELGTATRAARPFLRPAIEQFNEQDLKQSIR